MVSFDGRRVSRRTGCLKALAHTTHMRTGDGAALPAGSFQTFCHLVSHYWTKLFFLKIRFNISVNVFCSVCNVLRACLRLSSPYLKILLAK